MNKLGINLWNWRPILSDDCLGLPEKAASMGFTALELPMTQPEISDALKKEIKTSGLAVSLCAALGPGRDISNFDEAIRSNTREYFKRSLETGASVGAVILAGPLYAGGGKCHKLNASDKKKEWELAVKGLKWLSEEADQYGIRLAIEPLHRYRTSVVNTVEQAIQMMQDIGSDNLGIHYDTFHACLEEENLLESLKLALSTSRVYHFHACANNRSGPGEGIVPWGKVFGLLKEYRYENHITMETFAPGGLDASWVNVHKAPDIVAENGIKCLKQYFG